MAIFDLSSHIVSVDWLSEYLHQPDLIVLDATIKKVTAQDSDSHHTQLGIPEARFFDIKKEFSNKKSALPNMLPSPEDFAAACKKLGISNTSKIVVYDKLGIYSAPRVWWMFKAMGHNQIAVLDGGLPEWIKAGHPLGELDQDYLPFGKFTPNFQASWVSDSEDVMKLMHDPEVCILDARSAGRFNGTEPEPRAGLQSGHIPGSTSLPFKEVLDGGLFKSKEDLQEVFSNLNINNKKLIFTCGSGITASILMLAATIAEKQKGSVYDGSWSEWGAEDKFPVEV